MRPSQGAREWSGVFFVYLIMYMHFFFFLVDRRDSKAIINSHTQSRGTGVRTPIMTSGLTILTFLPVELRLMRQCICISISMFYVVNVIGGPDYNFVLFGLV
jgi:hypothetical protein